MRRCLNRAVDYLCLIVFLIAIFEEFMLFITFIPGVFCDLTYRYLALKYQQ